MMMIDKLPVSVFCLL